SAGWHAPILRHLDKEGSNWDTARAEALAKLLRLRTNAPTGSPLAPCARQLLPDVRPRFQPVPGRWRGSELHLPGEGRSPHRSGQARGNFRAGLDRCRAGGGKRSLQRDVEGGGRGVSGDGIPRSPGGARDGERRRPRRDVLADIESGRAAGCSQGAPERALEVAGTVFWNRAPAQILTGPTGAAPRRFPPRTASARRARVHWPRRGPRRR